MRTELAQERASIAIFKQEVPKNANFHTLAIYRVYANKMHAQENSRSRIFHSVS